MKQRSVWLPVLASSAVILLAIGYYLSVAGSIAEPMRFSFAGMSTETEEYTFFLAMGVQQELVPWRHARQTPYWYISQAWISSLMIQIPVKGLEELTRLTITVGDEDFEFGPDDFRNWDRSESEKLAARGDIPPGQVGLMVPNLFRLRSELPWVSPLLMNWPGDGRYLRSVFGHALLPILLVSLAGFFAAQKRTPAGQTWCRRILGVGLESNISAGRNTEQVSKDLTTSSQDRLWNWTGFLFLAGVFVFLEVRQPYYFTQCDSLFDSLPPILVGCRSIWQGKFPHYNPYLFMGFPLANIGLYTLTYPPLHLSYGLAKHLLDQECATLEVFAFLHLVVGFFASRALGRKLGMAALPANLAALSFVLSGATLIMGRSWHSFLPVTAWLPLLFLGLERLSQGPVSWRWVACMGVATGLPFHVGFPQVAIYLNGFFCLAAIYLFAVGSLSSDRLRPLLAALAVGAGLAAPLLYQQWIFARDANRAPHLAGNEGIICGLPALLLPYPLAETPLPPRWGNAEVQYLGHFYFFGGWLAALFFMQVVGLLFFRPERRHLAAQVWTFAALLALWLALGREGGLWTLVSQLPFAGTVNRHPLRMMPFVVFFICISGGLVLQRLLTYLPMRRRGEWVVAGLALSLLLLHVTHCRTAFFMYDGFTPETALPDRLAQIFWKDGQVTGRVRPIAPNNFPHVNYGVLMTLNLAAANALPIVEGTSALENKPITRAIQKSVVDAPLAALRRYGVRWLIVYAPERLPRFTSPYADSWLVEAVSLENALTNRQIAHGLPQVFAGKDYVVHDLAPVEALAYPAGKPDYNLPLAMHGQGLDVSIRGLARHQEIVINFVRHPEMRAYLNGRELVCQADSWNRIVLTIPEEGDVVLIRYCPPWGTGLWLGFALISLGLGLSFFHHSRPKSSRA